MRIDIRGNFRLEDLVVVAQHLTAQLEALGVAAVEDVSIELTPLAPTNRRLLVRDDAGKAEHLELEITDLMRPCLGTGTLRVVETPAPRRGSKNAPRRKYGRARG
ncbi:MAG: hypothetical protein K2Y42_20505 [Hyphomicrobium sp.]|jgi:hypothetical protein|uniref:hypothetical protein n=1 Tax=Hyphomicrobium sp. TaxID=82 RepID=UPI0025BCB228|nr:hypothetical protein [Hyphomicrobium sp.]MBX9865131.1 hypothetical protein [Hyphomicrobium sp.]